MRKERGISQEAWSEEMGSAKIPRELGRCVLSGVSVCSFITCMLNAINAFQNFQAPKSQQKFSVSEWTYNNQVDQEPDQFRAGQKFKHLIKGIVQMLL